jgi:hypothetical protein
VHGLAGKRAPVEGWGYDLIQELGNTVKMWFESNQQFDVHGRGMRGLAAPHAMSAHAQAGLCDANWEVRPRWTIFYGPPEG